jgi:hypothetical protein
MRGWLREKATVARQAGGFVVSSAERFGGWQILQDLLVSLVSATNVAETSEIQEIWERLRLTQTLTVLLRQ